MQAQLIKKKLKPKTKPKNNFNKSATVVRPLFVLVWISVSVLPCETDQIPELPQQLRTTAWGSHMDLTASAEAALQT